MKEHQFAGAAALPANLLQTKQAPVSSPPKTFPPPPSTIKSIEQDRAAFNTSPGDFTKSLRNSVCHGRVPEEDFEKMVPDQWWKTVFADGLYLKTDGDVVEDPEITKEEIR